MDLKLHHNIKQKNELQNLSKFLQVIFLLLLVYISFINDCPVNRINLSLF